MKEILLYSGHKVGLTVYNWRFPKKRYSKAGEICGFSQNLPLGVLVGNVCFFVADWRIFEPKKKKTGDDLYKPLIILLYSWLHTR